MSEEKQEKRVFDHPPDWTEIMPEIMEYSNRMINMNMELCYVLYLSNEELLKYTDLVTQNNVDQKWMNSVLVDEKQGRTNIRLDRVNAASLGNLAYIAFHASEPDVRETTQVHLKNIKDLMQHKYPRCLDKKAEESVDASFLLFVTVLIMLMVWSFVR